MPQACAGDTAAKQRALCSEDGIQVEPRGLQRRREAEADSGEERHRGAIPEHNRVRREAEINRRARNPRDPQSRQRHHHTQRSDAGDGGEQKAFREELPDQSSAARAERQPDADFAAAHRRACEEKIRDVGAHAQQDQADHRHCDRCDRQAVAQFLGAVEKCGGLDLHIGLALGMTRDRYVGIGLRGDQVECLPGLRGGNPGLEPADHPQPAKVPGGELARLRHELFAHQQRHPRVGHGDIRAAKVARRDAKDRDRLAIQRNRASDHATVTAELALPEIVAQHRERAGAGHCAFRSAPSAAELGGRAEHGKIISRRENGVELAGLHAADGEVRFLECDQIGDGSAAIAVIEVFRIRDAVKPVVNVAGVLAGKSLVEVDEAVRVLDRQRPPHNRVEQ